MRPIRPLSTILVVAALAVPAASMTTRSSVGVIDLTQGTHLKGSLAFAVNGDGIVAGLGRLPKLQSKVPGPPQVHALAWMPGNGSYELRDLGTLGGGGSLARAVNDNGQIAGSSEILEVGPGGGCIHAFLWTNGQMQDLGTLGGEDSFAYGVNINGRVVGQSQLPKLNAKAPGPPQVRAFLWSQQGGMTPLAPLPGGRNCSARAINGIEQIVGMSEEVDDPNEDRPGGGCVHAVLWMNGVVQDLGTLGGAEKSAALAINEAGRIAGLSEDRPGGGCVHAVLWTPGPNGYALQDLGTLGGENSAATGINDQGVVVGHSETADGSVHAFAWTPGAGMLDLGTAQGKGSVSFGINGGGKVAGGSSDLDPLTQFFERLCFIFRKIELENKPGKKQAQDDWTEGDGRIIRHPGRLQEFDATLWDLNPPPPHN